MKGPARRVQSFIFVDKTYIVQDRLHGLASNSCLSSFDAMDHVDNLKHKLLVVKQKQTNGKTLDTFVCSYAKDGHYKYVEL